MDEPTPEKSDRMERDFEDFQSPHEASVDRLIQAVDRAYHRPFLMMWRSFMHGFMTAVGATVGTAVIISLIGDIIQLQGGLSLLNPFIDHVQQTVINSQSKAIDQVLKGKGQ